MLQPKTEVNVDDISEENNNKAGCSETEIEKETDISTKPPLGIFSMESLIKPCRCEEISKYFIIDFKNIF